MAQTDKYHLIITSLFTSTAQLGSRTNIAVRAGLSLGITRGNAFWRVIVRLISAVWVDIGVIVCIQLLIYHNVKETLQQKSGKARAKNS